MAKSIAKGFPNPLTFHANKLSLAGFEKYLLGTHDLVKSKVKADCLVLEPTGIHYAKVWATVAEYVGLYIISYQTVGTFHGTSLHDFSIYFYAC